jgi:very-short-patch-repair endonuclease
MTDDKPFIGSEAMRSGEVRKHQLMVAAEYDGEQHRLDRRQYTRDIRRREELERLGWLVVRATVTDRPADIVGRVRDALEFRASSLR